MPFEKGTTIMLGRKASEETRLKMSLAHKGKKPSDWGAGFKPGNVPWNKPEAEKTPRGLIEKVYFAALVDGEGSIFITNNTNADGRYKKVCVAIAMRADKAQPLPQGQKIWGGSLHERQPRESNHSLVLDWRLYTKDAEKFLKDIKPFLRIKHVQTEVALKYRWLQTVRHPGTHKRVISEDEMKYRIELEDKLKLLNQ